MWESGESKMDKKGWIRIAEAFVSILIVIGAAIIVVKGGIQTDDISEKIYDIEVAILREIRLNDSLRDEILLTGGVINWTDMPSKTKNKISDKIPDWLDCVAQICLPDNQCLLTGESEKSVYAHSTLITSTVNYFNPRQLKLFCWEK